MIQGNMGDVILGGPDFLVGTELLSIIEAIITEEDDTVIPQMVKVAKDLNKIDIILKFAKAISDNL